MKVTTPLMSGFDMANASVIAPSDPVELRRMNFQVSCDWLRAGDHTC